MTLWTSRQNFLAYESQTPEDIQYGRKGGMFVSTCVCALFIIFAVILAVLVGVITYFITYFKVAQDPGVTDYWDETEPFGLSNPSPDLRLPTTVVPSFYRLKLNIDLETSNFTGEVYITIKANAPVKEIILHSKNLTINDNAKLTEQIYEKVETMHTRSKRQVNDSKVLTSESNQSESSTSANIQSDASTTGSVDTLSNVNSSIDENLNSSINSQPPDNINGTQESTPDILLPDNVTEKIETTTHKTEVPIPSIDTQVTHSSVRNVKIVDIQEATGDRLILKLGSSLTPNVDYTLQLPFSGQISNALTGFYKSTYKNADNENKNLGVTQFEPTSARAAFPCFDEPAFKAMFEISIAHRDNITVLSNMKVATEEIIPDQPGWKWTHFDRSVNMSTYLVAYILSDFKSLETTYLSMDNVTKLIRVWARPEYINKTRYALTIAPKLLSFYEEVFGVPYVLDKLDLIAIPDFSSGAMENWGLVTFRETTLLFDEESGVPRDKQNVAIDVAHELAHQWFGNLVTMRWWTDLWLNEGFATYIEYLGVDHIEPEWNMFESFARDKMDLLRSDALKNTSPVSRQVIDASEISQKFDEISYSKGANLIRMLNHTISEELFHKGLVYYLNDWKYMNAAENDLWKAMSRATESVPALKDLSMVQFMNTWTRQAGYPVVNVYRNYEKGLIEIEQKLFTTASDPYQSMIDQLWYIPISFTGVDAPVANWSTKPKVWLKDRFQVVSSPVNSSEALYVNVDAIGYYRVNYDQQNWQMLSASLAAGQVRSAVAKAQLIDDAFNLAKVSQLNYSYALGLTTAVMGGEDSKIVWDLLLNNMGFLRYNLRATSGYRYFQDYMRLLLQKQLEKLNFGLSKPKDDNEAFLTENLLTWECNVESQRCLAWAKDMFQRWMDRPEDNPIPSYLRSLVYNVALKYGGRREFDFLWNVFQNSSDPTVKSLVINNLPSTRDESLITMLLEKSLTEIPKQYAIAAWTVDAPVGTSVAQEFLLSNFERVYDKFTQMDAFMFPAVLSGAFGFISHPDDLDKLKAFATKYKQKLMPMSQTLQKLIDTATLRISWVRQHAQPITDWLRDFINNSTKSSRGPQTSENLNDSQNTPSNNTNIDTNAQSASEPVGPNVGVPNTGSNTTENTMANSTFGDNTNIGANIVSSPADSSANVPDVNKPPSL